MISVNICILLLAVLPAVLAKTNYCDPKLCNKDDKHVGCKNNGKFGPACDEPEIIEMTEEYKKQILDQHNSLRNKVARGFDKFPPAERMATMVWDDELAQLAVLNVKKCEVSHDKCHNTENFPYAGQNLASEGWYGKHLEISEVIDMKIQEWFDEHNVCPTNVIGKYTSPTDDNDYGHFTAMMQDKSTHVGCGIVRYQDGIFLNQLMACNYALTNMKRRPVYSQGPSASKCTTGTNKQYKSLCSIREKYSYK